MSEKDQKGFSGLSSLISDVSSTDGISSTEPSLPSPESSKITSGPTAKDETAPKVSSSQRPVEIDRFFKTARRIKWKRFFGIIGIIVIIWVIANLGENTRETTYKPPSSSDQSYDSQPTRSTLLREIEDGKTRLEQMQTRLNSINNRLDDYQRKMNAYERLNMIDEYNYIVPIYNSLLSEGDDLYEEYTRLVDEVNSKVVRYNSGYR